MNTNLISTFEQIADEMAYDFFKYMGLGVINEYSYWTGDDCTGTMEHNDWYFSLGDMYEVLKNQYDPKIVKAHYDYNINFSLDRKYGINLKTFSQIWDGTDVVEWSQKYHQERDRNTSFWKSPEGLKKQEENLKPLLDKFQEDIANLK